ncbi:hypothetical protein M9H77_30491 [Catharanthus roseus]|uniref:Uncharacterized protein n=1 Tax=Catharanthus roseus TaxID=4058 RepID=A0ACB9ZXR5_CATRO|nr:hypothetical protein M9H77_30491 [Catharanthus roseus]
MEATRFQSKKFPDGMGADGSVHYHCRHVIGEVGRPSATVNGRSRPTVGGRIHRFLVLCRVVPFVFPIFPFLSTLPIAPKKAVASSSKSKSKRARVEGTSPNPTPNVLLFPETSFGFFPGMARR